MKHGRLVGLMLALLIAVPAVDATSYTCCRKSSRKSSAAKFVFAGIGLVGLVGLFRWFRRPEKFVPTVDNLNTITVRQGAIVDEPTLEIAQLVKQIHRGKMPARVSVPLHEADDTRSISIQKGLQLAPEDTEVVLYSRGYANATRPGKNDNFIQRGGCAMAAYRQSRDHILNSAAPCVVFDYPDRRRVFSFGQKSETDCLRTIYRAIRECSPHANVTLVGNCRGAKTALDMCADRPERVKAVLLMSPFMSAKDMTHSIANHHLKKLPRSPDVLYNFFKLWFPNYKEEEDKIIFARLQAIDPQLPILIGHRKNDALIPDYQMEDLINHIKAGGNQQVQLFSFEDTTFSHDRAHEVPAFQWAANAFLKRCGAASDERLAWRGEHLMPPRDTDGLDWVVTPAMSQRVALAG